MAKITTQNRIAYQIDSLGVVPEDISGLSILNHFDYPEAWNYIGNAGITSVSKFGKGCAYFPDTSSSVTVTNNTGMFNLNPYGNYEFEFFAKFNDIEAGLQSQGYSFYGGHTFKYFSSSVTWAEAETACEELGGHLATSTSAEKNAFLFEVCNGSYTWLGATDEAEEGTWLWITGEAWDYTNWGNNQPDNYQSAQHYMMFQGTLQSTEGKWDDDNATSVRNYICEWDRDFRESTRNILNIDDKLNLSLLSNMTLTLSSPSSAWNTEGASSTALTLDTWYHIVLRISGQSVFLFLNGAEEVNELINGRDEITPSLITLGGYIGCLDEFVFRRNAGTGAPTVPTLAYEQGTTETVTPAPTVSSNAPVTRAVWTAENLPDGVVLSTDGVLSGHPMTAGTYTPTIRVATNWGTASKTINIKVQ